MKAKISDLAMTYDGQFLKVTFLVPRIYAKTIDELTKCDVELSVKKYRMSRTKDANSYCWVLLAKLGEKLGRSKDDLYEYFIRRCNYYSDVMVLPEGYELLKARCKHVDIVKEDYEYMVADGIKKKLIWARVYEGSSTFDTLQMSRFLEDIIAECEAQQIETLTPKEKERLINLWGQKWEEK